MRSRPIVPWKSGVQREAEHDVGAHVIELVLLNQTILWILDAQTVKLFHLRLTPLQNDLMAMGAENQALANHWNHLYEFCETVWIKMEHAVGYELVLPYCLNEEHSEA